MNIIKLNDIILDETSGLDEKYINIFNNYLRGRYVHCICWNYVIPLDELASSNVKSLCDELLNEPDEDTLLDLHGYHWMKLSQIINYVDQSTTVKINDINKYNSYNDFLPSELTIDDLKKFRTWIAETILSFNIIKEDKINNMLSYYANGMYDKVIENLTMFSSDTSYELITTSSSSCGCSQSSQTLAQLQNISTCQPIVLYRKSIYKYMISIFSNMDWWLDFDPEFLEMFKTYVDGIIKINLPFVASSVIDDDYVECGCNITSNTLQQRAIERLNRLSESLKMMINNDTSGHRNYITSALTDWATYLYEIMEW